MKNISHRRRAGFKALCACAVVVVMTAASVAATPSSAEATTPPAAKKTATLAVSRAKMDAKLPAKPYVSPYTRAAMAHHTSAAHVTTGSAPTAVQAAGRPSRRHAPGTH
jgi:hypothetical protein